MSIGQGIGRRRVLQGAAAGLAGAAIGTGAARAAGKLTVGFIYVGSETDYGYNQAHAEGAKAVRAMPGVSVVQQAKVPETVAVANTMGSMINLDGATLLFPTSFGYFDPYVLKAAKANKKVTFMHCGGLWKAGEPTNAHSYFGYIDEAVYVSGIVAGHMTKTKKFGFIAAKPIPQVLRNINAFTLAAQSVDPSITTQVIFTGDWFMPVREAEATNSLADQGVDVITCHVDSPKVVMETAEKRGLFTCGYHTNQAVLAPKGYLTGAEWNWPHVYPDFVTAIMAGKTLPNMIRGGFKDGFVRNSAYNAIVPDAARKQADAVRAKFTAGDVVIFKGPLKDNKGKIVIPAGTTMGERDVALESMNYLVAGVSGSTS
ncbi:MAG TPA: BMP family ABC transporter substrate-binding protein [Acetobacteraceae bacterium]|nr:BMP family ABC transporter substrate-binding protein [Acetobacteraceae bacterium]